MSGQLLQLIDKVHRLGCFLHEVSIPWKSFEKPEPHVEPYPEEFEDEHLCISNFPWSAQQSVASQSGYEELRRLALLRSVALGEDLSIPQHCSLSQARANMFDHDSPSLHQRELQWRKLVCEKSFRTHRYRQ
jgi:hypothetical protein